MKLLKTAVYCRISTAEDIQLHSLESQRKYYESFIEAHPGYVLTGIYADTASGTKRRGRLQFTKMIQDCRKGKIDIIFTKSISRFARNSLDFLIIIRELKALSVDVYFENEQILLSKERNEFRMATLAAVAQEESLMKSRSIRWALNVGFTTGTSKLANRPCYGYVNDAKGELVIDPASAETVKMIFRLYLDDHSLSGIAKELYRLRIPSPTGKETWTACAIDKVLSNEKYVGIVLLQKTYVPDVLKGVQVKNNGEQARYLYENNHIGIIDQETFEAVQAE
ncbi:MAG: recombinase family protein, partial [Oscillospiraceae bacterium]|nr:recombinase family protein [Oscillospiraceae bacterium]